MTLNTEDSIEPIQCDPSVHYPVATPFLYPPYHGWTSIVSYFDHDMPSFAQDGLIVTANGVQAAPDATHHQSDFPAYWNAGIRQYLYYDGHNGYDFDLWYQPVYAAAAGKVIFADYEYPTMPDHGYGKMVMIQHRSGYVTLYGHFSKFLVKTGEKVRRGQEIGISGNTGHSTGPHLHFTVFHNCNLTDPYGWTGPGPDPLSSWKGESSSFLWAAVPEVLNPLNAWPALNRLPPTSIERIVLLKLPGTSNGSEAFTAALKQEAEKVRHALSGYGGTVAIDLLQGAVDVRAPVPFARLYAATGAVSITSADTIEGDKADVLAALARAALVRPHPAVPLGRSSRWSGFVMLWDGRTLLVGRGEKGRAVDLRLPSGKGGAQLKTLNADPKTGEYVIDLGRLSSSQRQRLDRTLKAAARSGSAVRVHRRSRAVQTRPGRTRVDDVRRSSGFPWVVVAILGLLACVGAVGFATRRRFMGTAS